MNTREKLIELIRKPIAILPDKKFSPHIKFTLPYAEELADHLIANGVTVQEWISVKDRLPEKDGRYLVFDGDTGNYYDSYYDETEREFGEWQNCFDPSTLGVIDCEWNSCPNVTHWMPLPPAPEEEK